MFNEEQAAAYLAAMIDGEGWIGEPKTVHNRAVRIANTDPDLIEAMREACDVLGITYTVQRIAARGPNRTPGFLLDITGRENMRRILAVVPIRATRKRDRLVRTIASYRQPEPLEREVLEHLYLREGLTQREVAARLGVGFKRVLLAMRRLDIARRGHGPERSQTAWRARRAKYGAKGRH